jgi:hypothetical protein
VKQRGRFDAVAGVVGEAAGALRRRRTARQPYAKLYDGDDVRVLDPASEQARALLETAAAMVEVVAPRPKNTQSPDF